MKQTIRRRYLLFNIMALVITVGVLLGRQSCSTESEIENWSNDFDPSIAIAKGNLVFVGRGRGGSDVYRLDLKTGEVIPLTKTDTEESNIAISRDGTKIAYIQGDEGGKVIYSNIDGSHVRTVGLNKEAVSQPIFSDKDDCIFYARANITRTDTLHPDWEDWDLYSFNLKDFSTRKLSSISSSYIDNPQFLNKDTILFSYEKGDLSETSPTLASVNIKSGVMKLGKEVFGNKEFGSYDDIDMYPIRGQKFVVFIGTNSPFGYCMKLIQKTSTGHKVLIRENDIVATSLVEGKEGILLSSQAPSSKENSGLIMFSLKDGKKTKIADYDFFLNPSSVKISPAGLRDLRRL